MARQEQCSSDRDGGPPLRIAYLTTHYPRVALTFIASEIDAVERTGIAIAPIAINPPSPGDLPDDDARRRAAGTLCLKASLVRVLGRAALGFLTQPVRFTKLLMLALGSSGADLRVAAVRLVHLCYAARVAHHCRTEGIRHVHAHFGLTPATIAWFASELSRGRPWAIGWSFTIHGFQDFIEHKLARLDLKARSARFVVCISDFTRSQLCRISDPSDWDRFHVVRCGLDLDKFAFRGTPPPDGAPRIVTVGRLSPEKGHVVLLQAMRQLIDAGLAVRLRIVGSGPFEHAIRARAQALDLEDHIEMCGEKVPDEVIALLKSSDLFCLPSFSEGLPVSIMEAMAIGIPVVTTGISGIPELVRDGVTGWTAPPANPAALAAALERALSTRADWPAVLRNAREAVERDHDRDRNARLLLNLFNE